MTSLYQRNDSVRRGRRRLLLSTLLVLAVLLADILAHGALREFVREQGSRSWRAGMAAAAAFGGTDYLVSRASLEEQITTLEQRAARLEIERAGYGALKEENEQLRTLVRAAALNEGITAPVVSSVISSPYGTFLVGAGSAESVAKGDIVMAGDFVVGRVAEAGAHRSLVKTALSPDASIEAAIGKSSVLIEGRGGGNGYAKLPHGVAVSSGDPVVAQEFGARAIGIVASVASSSASAYSDIYIGLPLSLETLRFVYIFHENP